MLLFLVLLGPAVSVQIPFLGTTRAVANVSLYELAMVPVALIALFVRPATWPAASRIIVFLTPVLLVALHSLFVAVSFPGLAFGDLVKETTKFTSFFLFALLLAVFLKSHIEQTAFRRTVTLALLAVLALMFVDWVRFYASHSVPGGSLAPHAAVVLLYLYVVTGGGPLRNAPVSWAIPVSAVIVIGLWGTKLYVGLVLVVAIWGLSAGPLTRHFGRQQVGFAVLACALLLSVVGLAAWWELAAPHGRSLSSSIEERLRLWAFAWELFQTHSPWGVGLGQYAAKAAAADTAAGVIDYYAHNTLLSMLAELGVLGFVVMGFLLAAVFVSIGCGPHVHVWIALLIAIAPMLLHDVLSYRSLQILLAAGLAGFLTNENSLSDRLRPR